MLVHQVFFFPGLGLQAAVYLAWLLDRTWSATAAEARRVDARVRQAMALSPRELLTEQDLDQFLGERGLEAAIRRRGPAPAPAPRSAGVLCRERAEFPARPAGCTSARPLESAAAGAVQCGHRPWGSRDFPDGISSAGPAQREPGADADPAGRPGRRLPGGLRLHVVGSVDPPGPSFAGALRDPRQRRRSAKRRPKCPLSGAPGGGSPAAASLLLLISSSQDLVSRSLQDLFSRSPSTTSPRRPGRRTAQQRDREPGARSAGPGPLND